MKKVQEACLYYTDRVMSVDTFYTHVQYVQMAKEDMDVVLEYLVYKKHVVVEVVNDQKVTDATTNDRLTL